jgi:small subunit ribosomal protein S18
LHFAREEVFVAAGKRGKAPDSPSSSRPRRGGGVFEGRRRSCYFCRGRIAEVDYKRIDELRRFISGRAQIRGRGSTGTCRKHQNQVAVAIKRAREMALLPYVGEAKEPPRPRARRSD